MNRWASRYGISSNAKDIYKREITENKAKKESYIDKACKYINKRYSEHLSIEKITEHLVLNKHYLIRLFEKIGNYTK